MYGFRLKVKFGRKWKLGIVSYTDEASADERVTELIKLGLKKSSIMIIPEIEIFQ